MREVLGDAAIYFDPQDVNDMSRAIQKAIEDNVLRSSLLNEGTVQTSKYSYEKAAVAHLEVYSSVANSWYE
jgi:glycosyltransferase involved in cell wall biosynthesis